MVRNNINDRYFLFMEPNIELKSEQPIDDLATRAVDYYCSRGISGTSRYSDLADTGKEFQIGGGWRSSHTFDGYSSSVELSICNEKYITNRIAPHYTRYYRSQITGPDLEKLQIITECYQQEIINKIPKLNHD